MSVESVKFQIKGKTFEKSFDRSKIKLGKFFFIKEIDKGNDIEFSENEFENSKKHVVSWIATSVWAVTLIDIYYLEYSQVTLTQKLLERYMPPEEILDCLSFQVSKLRLEHLYKTSEFEESRLRVIFAVVERLNFIDSLKDEDVSGKLFHNWEPVIVYHLLTCFDLLGQPDTWRTFDSWLTASSCQDERDGITARIDPTLSNIEFSKQLFQSYQENYGVKKSFFRFIRKILPPDNRKELFNSIKIRTNSMPPSNEVISEEGTESDKEKFLYDLRNNYTHKAKVVHGFDTEKMFGSQSNYKNVFNIRFQEFKEKKWIIYMTSNWPWALEHFVKIGLSEYLKNRNGENATEYIKYSFKHKYFRAFRPDKTEKEGVNRILFDLNGEEITREYVPEGFPKEFEWATVAEINKYNTMYPDIERSELIRPI